MDKVIFGIDVGGTTIKLGSFTVNGDLLKRWEIPTRTIDNGQNILSDICTQIEEYLSFGFQLKGVGIGLPGPVTKNGEVLGCVNLGWTTFNIEETLSEMLGGIKVKAGNDATLAAYGEFFKGAGEGCLDMVLITLGTGIGAGIIVDGNLLLGYNGAAGEIGHMPLVYNETTECSCGITGCLEQVSSATGLVKEAEKLLNKTNIESVLRNLKTFSAKDIIESAKAGDAASIEVVDNSMEYLAIALACIASVVNPNLILIGGGMSKAGDFLIKRLKEKFSQKVFKPCGDVEFKMASLGNDAGITGAAALIIQS